MHYVFENVLGGFAATISEEALPSFEGHPAVDRITPDRVYHRAKESASTWGLDRINQRELPLDGTFAPIGSGQGVDMYILDTGIWSAHDEFSNRVAQGVENRFDAWRDSADVHFGEDCIPHPDSVVPWGNIHGTHVAGTAGGDSYGVANTVDLYSVKVLSCTGVGTDMDSTMVSVAIAGMDWVVGHHQASNPAARTSTM